MTQSKKVLWLIGLAVLIATTSKLWFFTYNPYFQLVKIPVMYFGIIFCGINLVALVFSMYGRVISKRIGDRACIVLFPLIMGIPILFMSLVVHRASVGMVFFENVVRGMKTPFINYRLNQLIPTECRTTVLSIQSSCVCFAHFITLGMFGLLLQNVSLLVGLQAISLFVIIGGALLIVQYRRLFGE